MTTSTILDRLGPSHTTSYTGIEMIIFGSTAEACKSTLDLPVADSLRRATHPHAHVGAARATTESGAGREWLEA